MQWRIKVHAVTDGWEVEIVDTDDQPLMDERGIPFPARLLSRCAVEDDVFPQPPLDETTTIPVDALHRDLCRDRDGAQLYHAYRDIVGRAEKESHVVRFGRYLHATLFGVERWAQLQAHAQTSPVELALCFEPNDHPINRLPWEMMYYNAERAVLAEPNFWLTRRVQVAPDRQLKPAAHDEGQNEQTIDLISPPHVLFVVGSDLNNQGIQPGAEYLGLIRAMHNRERELSLKTHLLLAATTESLAAAIEAFKPTIVHFVCHGGFTNGRGFLQLVDEHNPQKLKEVYSDALLEALKDPPQIVVLNTCSSGGADDVNLCEVGQFGTPLAVELVQGGIPLVVGMGGEVADQACRLFTRCFYESLLEDGQVVQATAEGRRVGIILHDGSDPRSSVDWALPMIFMANHISNTRITETSREIERIWHQAASQYVNPEYPPFCGRFDLVRKYCVLMAPTNIQRRILARTNDLQTLAVYIPKRDEEGVQYGRTWLLHEMAAQAARDGHLPVLLSSPWMEPDNLPKNRDQLLAVLRDVTAFTKATFQLDWSWTYVQRLLDLQVGNPLPDEFPDSVRDVYSSREPARDRTLAVAFREDMLALLAAARRKRGGDTPMRLLLLIDDVHKMHKAARYLLKHLLSPYGLRAASEHIRIVLAYAAEPAQGQAVAIGFIKEFLDHANAVERIELKGWQPLPSIEEELAYRYFLLYWQPRTGERKPLTVVRRATNIGLIEAFFEAMTEVIQGIPSRIKTHANPIINLTLKIPEPLLFLQPANDEAALKMLQDREGWRRL